MGLTDRESLEKTGAAFSEKGLLEARRRTWEAVHAIARRIQPGMTEADGHAIAQEELERLGTHRLWHRPMIRFGPNTLKPFGAPSEEGVVLQERDVFFVDIGPVFEGFEGDAGATFQRGNDPEHSRCIRDGREIFQIVKAHWKTGVTGEALYAFAQERAAERGWMLTLEEANGHRLSDFPHALYFRGGISELAFPPAEHRWVLEIQIRHPERPFGSFHEDLLVAAPPEDPFADTPGQSPPPQP